MDDVVFHLNTNVKGLQRPQQNCSSTFHMTSTELYHQAIVSLTLPFINGKFQSHFFTPYTNAGGRFPF